MQGGGFYLTYKDGVVPMGDLTHELAFHGAYRVGEDRQTQGSQAERCSIEASTHPLLGLEKDGGKVFLICLEHIEAKFARSLDHAIAGAVCPHGHNHQGRFKAPLGDPAGGEPVHLIALGHATDEHAVGDLAQQGLFGFGVESGVLGHGGRSTLGRGKLR